MSWPRRGQDLPPVVVRAGVSPDPLGRLGRLHAWIVRAGLVLAWCPRSSLLRLTRADWQSTLALEPALLLGVPLVDLDRAGSYTALGLGVVAASIAVGTVPEITFTDAGHVTALLVGLAFAPLIARWQAHASPRAALGGQPLRVARLRKQPLERRRRRRAPSPG